MKVFNNREVFMADFLFVLNERVKRGGHPSTRSQREVFKLDICRRDRGLFL
jgi:hypothetical protein